MTLLELLRLLKRKIWLVIALPVVFALVVAGYSFGFMANQYTSQVRLYILTQTSSSETITTSDTTVSQQLANDIAQLVDSTSVVNGAAQALGMSNLNGYAIKVDSSTTNRMIVLNVTGTDPQSTAKVADEMAEQLSKRSVEIMDLKAVNIVDNATVPTSPSGPNRPLYIAAAFLIGLFLAIAIVILIDALDVRVKSRDDLASKHDLSVLGALPTVKKVK